MVRMKGLYTLLIRVAKDLVVDTRRTRFNVPRGLYLYVGSAMGPHAHSVEARILRHLRKRKKSFWHIDYLLKSGKASVRGVVYSQSRKRLECGLALHLKRQLNLWIPIDGFGSSDCICMSHLFRAVAGTTFETLLKRTVKAYRNVGLSPNVMSDR
jgi:Uri superfamily endonuclease